MSPILAGLRLSAGLFTALPMGDVGAAASDRRVVRNAILWSPLIGGLLGLAAAVIMLGVREIGFHTAPPDAQGLASGLAAAAAVGFLVAATKAMHLDGLADTVDGMAAHRDAAGTLAVMRKSDIGPMGVATVALVIVAEVAALSLAVIKGHSTLAVITAAVAGRCAVVWCCRYPAASPSGLGAWVAGTTTTVQAVVITALAMTVPFVLLARDDDPRARVAPYAAVAIPVAIGVSLLMQRMWRHRVGGISGDTLGASIETATAAALVLLAFAPA